MSTGGSVQPSLFDDLDDACSGPVVVVGLVAGQQESTEGSDDRSSADVPIVPAVTETRQPTPVGVGGRAATDQPSTSGGRAASMAGERERWMAQMLACAPELPAGVATQIARVLRSRSAG